MYLSPFRIGLFTGTPLVGAGIGIHMQGVLDQAFSQAQLINPVPSPALAIGGLVTGTVLGLCLGAPFRNGRQAVNSFRSMVGRETIPLPNVKKRPVGFDPALHTNTIFAVMSHYHNDDLEADFCKAFSAYLETLPSKENILVLGFERMQMGLDRYGDCWHEDSLIAKGMCSWKRTQPHIMLLLGGYFLDSNGNSWRVNKDQAPSEKFEDDAVAFRLCSTLQKFPLSPTPLYYIVPACNIGDDLPAAGKRQTIYINDVHKGIRRLNFASDSGWLLPTPNGVRALDDEKCSHHVFDVSSGVFVGQR